MDAKIKSTDKNTTKRLITELRNGDQLAFTELYNLYSKPLYRNILRLVKDADIAQELLQDLFLKIWEVRAKIKDEGSFKSFLYKVSGNLVYRHFRKIAQDNRLIHRLTIDYIESDANAETNIINRENNDLLQKAIGSLSPKRKLIYTLCKLEGKSHEEVSNELGISVSTVNNQIVKANRAVKQFFLENSYLAMVLAISQFFKHLK